MPIAVYVNEIDTFVQNNVFKPGMFILGFTGTAGF